MKERHWQEWAILLLGLWAIVSPWTIAHVMASPENPAGVSEAVMWNHYATGIALAVLAAAALFAFKPWEDWLMLTLGAWLLASPWVPGFGGSPALLLNAVIVGALIVLFAGWTLAEQRGLRPAAK